MRAGWIGLALAAVVAAPAMAAGSGPEPAATVRTFIDAFDKGDVKAAKATHWAAGASIVDEVPPYLWQGATAFDDWAAALTANDKAAGIDHDMVTLGDLVRTEWKGRRAYVVFNATYTFQQHGVAMREPARMTFALRKTPEGEWKIAAWAWTGPKPSAAK